MRYCDVTIRILLCLSFCAIFEVSGAAGTQCKDGWIRTEGLKNNIVCTKMFPAAIWREAASTCQAEGGSLLSLDGASVDDVTLKAVIDMLDPEQDIWTSLHFSGDRLWWNKATPTPYVEIPSKAPLPWSWASGQPLMASRAHECASARRNNNDAILELSLTECGVILPFVCINNGVDSTFETGHGCDDGWLGNAHSDVCLWLSDDEYTFSEAADLCESMDAIMASPDTLFQQYLFSGFMAENLPTDEFRINPGTKRMPTKTTTATIRTTQDEPSEITEQLSETTKQPSETTEPLSHTSERPSKITAEQLSETTEQPSETTDQLFTTDEPSTRAYNPPSSIVQPSTAIVQPEILIPTTTRVPFDFRDFILGHRRSSTRSKLVFFFVS